jgi:hypothetical protein
MICCFFSSFKTFAMLREATYPPAAVNVLDISSESMAAFQVFLYGRFWVFTEALGVIVSDKSLPQDQRRKLALEIAQHHKDARQRQPLQQFVDEVKSELSVTSDDDLEPDYARWHRSKESDDPVLLLKLASGLEPASTERQSLAHRMLALFYGWTDLNAPGFDGNHWERKAVFDRIRALKKRSIEEVKQTIHAEIENKRSKEDWQALVKNDNQRAEHLVKAAASGSPEGLCELQQYRQCSNCAHASHIDRTHQGKCHHCGRINFGTEAMKWLPVMKLADVPRCMGLFPCIKT